MMDASERKKEENGGNRTEDEIAEIDKSEKREEDGACSDQELDELLNC